MLQQTHHRAKAAEAGRRQNYLFHYIITQAFPVGIHINSRPEPLLSWGFSSAFQRCKVNLDHFLATPCVHTNLDCSNNSRLASWSEFRTLFQSSGFLEIALKFVLMQGVQMHTPEHYIVLTSRGKRAHFQKKIQE